MQVLQAPTVLFDAKKISHALRSEEIPGTSYGHSNKGWMNTNLYKLWVRDHFIKHAVGALPLLLLFDGHSTPY